MKIGYPATGSLDTEKYLLSTDFTESGLIGVFDTETRKTVVVTKESIDKSLIDWLEVNGIKTIITPELKKMALKVFTEQDIKVFKAVGSMIYLNAELLENNGLTKLTGYEGSSCSSSDCSSCSSTCG